MAEPSTPHEDARPQVFISYSHADQQRVMGLVWLLKALGHNVFIDFWSISPGQRWEDTLQEALQAADVLLVFWTRHAAQSKWVRREYETFDTRFPRGLLVPMRGDRTPLTATLGAHQSPDFCPLLNELFETVRDLTEKHISKRQIRAVVLRRLEEEGINLPLDMRHLLFGLFGILPRVMVPLYCLQCGRDCLVDFLQRQRPLLVDRIAAVVDTFTALPAAYYYTAGVAITAEFLTCDGAARGLDTIAYKKGHEAAQVEVRQQARLLSQRMAAVDAEVEARVAQGIAEAQRELRDAFEERLRSMSAKLLQQPELFRVDVRLNQSGTDACDSQGMICVSMTRKPIHDQNDKFFGNSTPTCSARVIRASRCSPETDYAMKGVVLRRSPEADAGVADLSGLDHFCLASEKGKQGIFQFANCVKP